MKGTDDVDQENSRSENNNTTDSPSPSAAGGVNESEQSLEEADNIVQDALQLAENDELNEYRDYVRSFPSLIMFLDLWSSYLLIQIDSHGEDNSKSSKQRSKGKETFFCFSVTL